LPISLHPTQQYVPVYVLTSQIYQVIRLQSGAGHLPEVRREHQHFKTLRIYASILPEHIQSLLLQLMETARILK